mmetsp:Transcript_8/g.29  ORF Transcript_8/g.29 Transcript_8/m.29 type:complete len:195 (+) Transcript_8:1295-1879(+)
MAAMPLIDFQLRWKPYELAPSSGPGRTLPKKHAYLSMMGDPFKVQSYFERLQGEGSLTGIAFEFEGLTSSTFDAHRLAEWCLATHGDSAQDRLIEAQFVQFFERGRAPNDIEAQVEAAVAAGLNADGARAVLNDKRAFADATRAKLVAARHGGVRGVPSFSIGGHEVAYGAQSIEYWVRVLQHHHLRQLADVLR